MDDPILLGGRFELRRVLAHRPEGDVHLAWDREMGGEVALTRVHAALSRDPATLEALRAGVREAGKVRAAGALRTHDLHVLDGAAVVVSDAPDGESLRSLREAAPEGLDAGAATDILCGAAVVLRDAGQAHGSLLPESIWVAADGRVQVADFAWGGMAAALEDHRGDESSSLEPFSAPEERRKRKGRGTPAGDVFALGMLGYWMLGGQATAGQIGSVRDLRPGVPRALGRTVDDALAAAPQDRPADAAALAAALGAQAASRTASPGPSRWPWIVAIAATLLIGVGTAALTGLIPSAGQEAPEVETAVERALAEQDGLYELASRAGVAGMLGMDDVSFLDEDGAPLPAEQRAAMIKVGVKLIATEARTATYAKHDGLVARRDGVEAALRGLETQERDSEARLASVPDDRIGDAQRAAIRTLKGRAGAADTLDAWDTQVFGSAPWATTIDDLGAADARFVEAAYTEAAQSYGLLGEAFDGFGATMDGIAAGATSADGGAQGEPEIYSMSPAEIATLAKKAGVEVDSAVEGTLAVSPDGTVEVVLADADGDVTLGGTWEEEPEASEGEEPLTGEPGGNANEAGQGRRARLRIKILFGGRKRLAGILSALIKVADGKASGVLALGDAPAGTLEGALEGLGKSSETSTEAGEAPADAKPTAITLKAPEAGAVVKGPRLAVAGSVGRNDRDGRVGLNGKAAPLIGGSFRGHAGAQRDGKVWVEAAHAKHRYAGSARARAVTMDSTPPLIDLKTPAREERLQPGDSVVVSGTVFDLHFDRILINGTVIDHELSGTTASFEYRIQMDAARTAKITIEAYDKAGNRSVITRSHDRAERSVPDIVIVEPADGEIVATSDIRVRGYVPVQVEESELTVNGQSVPVANGVFETILKGTRDGKFPIRADYKGRWIADTYTALAVEVDTTPPVLVVSAPADESRTKSRHVWLRGTVRDANPSRVLIDGQARKISGTGTFRTRVRLTPREWTTITVFAEDKAGHVSEQIQRRVFSEYEIPVPPPVITEPRRRSVHPPGTILVRGRVPGVTDQSILTINGTRVALRGSSFQTRLQANNDGPFLIEAVHSGAGIRESQSDVQINIDAIAPTLQINYPTPNTYQVPTSRIQVSGRADDPSLRRLEIIVNGVSRHTRPGSGGKFRVQVRLQAHVDTAIVVQATDAGGLVTTEERLVKYVPKVPEVIIQKRIPKGPSITDLDDVGRTGPPALTYDLDFRASMYYWRQRHDKGGGGRTTMWTRWVGRGPPPGVSYEIQVLMQAELITQSRTATVRLVKPRLHLKRQGNYLMWEMIVLGNLRSVSMRLDPVPLGPRPRTKDSQRGLIDPNAPVIQERIPVLPPKLNFIDHVFEIIDKGRVVKRVPHRVSARPQGARR